MISVIQFKLDDIYRAPEVGQQLEQQADQFTASRGFMTTNWMEQNKPLFHALRLERLVTFITIGLIVLGSTFDILISLTMMVMEKTRDIAVLMSMGTKKRQIRRIFIAQGMLIGVIGTLIGLAIGFGISWAGGRYHFILPLARGLFHRLRPLRPASHGRPHRSASLHWNFLRRDDLSVVGSVEDSAGGGAALRVGRVGTAALGCPGERSSPPILSDAASPGFPYVDIGRSSVGLFVGL